MLRHTTYDHLWLPPVNVKACSRLLKALGVPPPVNRRYLSYIMQGTPPTGWRSPTQVTQGAPPGDRTGATEIRQGAPPTGRKLWLVSGSDQLLHASKHTRLRVQDTIGKIKSKEIAN